MVSGAGAICAGAAGATGAGAGAAGAAEGVAAGDGAGGGAVVAAAGALIAEVSEDPLQSSLGRMASFFEK